MAGLGSPFGVTPFGTGTPAATVAPPSGPPLRARYLDPVTRDYVFDDEGEFERMPIVRQQMLIALTTRHGSRSVDRNAGIPLPQFVGKNIERDMTDAVIRATNHITSTGSARIIHVSVEEVRPGSIVTTVSYEDLTLGVIDQVSF